MSDKEIKTYKIMNVARSGWGKTHNAIEMITQFINKGEIDPRRIIIFSPTIRTNPIQIDFSKFVQSKINQKIKEEKQQKIQEKYDFLEQNTSKRIQHKFLDKLYHAQEILKQKQMEGKNVKYHHWLIYFDDMQGDGLFHSADILKKIFLTGRHYGISIIVNLQTYRSSMDKVLKDQVSNILIGDLNSEDSKFDVIKQYCSGFRDNPRDSSLDLYKLYLEILKMNGNHGFLNINCEKATGEGRFQIGLSEQFLDK